MVNTPTGNIIIDCGINFHDSFVTVVNFLHEAKNERAASATALTKRNTIDIYIELGHPPETITHATTKALVIQVTSIFKPCENCALGNTKG